MIEAIENTYIAFRKAIDLMVLNTTCQCNACANISSLDLKFFVHYGTFAIQHIRNHNELIGNDVNLIHCLLKNHISEKIGARAYTLITNKAIQQLDLEEISETMTPHVERYEEHGEVQVWVQDMHPVWERKKNTNQINLPPEKVFAQSEIDFNMSPEQLWHYLTLPKFQNMLYRTDRIEVTNRSGGRIAPGSVYQCYHGDEIIPVTIHEWNPFKGMMTQLLVPIPIPDTTFLIELQLTPTEHGSRLHELVSKPTSPLLGRVLVFLMMPKLIKQGKQDYLKFKSQIERDLLEKEVPP